VITDHAMPGTSGTQLAAILQRDWPGLPVGLISGYAEFADKLQPDLPRLAKPYRQDQLIKLVATLAQQGRQPSRGLKASAAAK
jgi:FixJ family two-component response regulator